MSQPRHSTRTTANSAGRHRAAPKPRYGRIATVAVAAFVTVVAVAGGLGLLPTADDTAEASANLSTGKATSTPKDSSATAAKAADAAGDPAGQSASKSQADADPAAVTPVEQPPSDAAQKAAQKVANSDRTLPPDSGSGRRIVFSQGRQRAWLVDSRGHVERTYLVSGSLTDNLKPGTYSVFSRSRNAIGIDDSGTMEYFVRFTYGTGGAAIGFHTIPVDEGKPVQTRAQLGSPRSHGCIRQDRADAIALWDFAPTGTKVVVTA